MHRVFLTWVFIGIFHCGLSHAVEVPTSDEMPSPGHVIVEPTNVTENVADNQYELVPYDQRRPTWGVTVGLDYNSFIPDKYTPNFIELDYSSVYAAPSTPNLGLDFAVKRNFDFGSLGLEFGFSVFHADSKEEIRDLIESSLNLYLLRLGVQFNMEHLFSRTPYLVPYISGGVYTVYYDEKQASTAFKGNTQVAPYLTAGLALQLDWMDKNSARDGYEGSGLENSFLFAEVRSLFATQDDSDPDFTTSTPTWGAGIKVEF